jgi:hypothetical protein
MRASIALSLLLLSAPVLSAQRLEPAAFRPAVMQMRGADTAIKPRVSPDDAALLRTFLGVGGAVGGLFGGALLGASMHGQCSCDDPGLAEAIIGGAVGTILSSAIISSLPDLGSKCSLASRIGTSLLTSTAGGVIGGFVGAKAGGITPLITYVAGSGIGAAIGSSLCR